MQNKVAIITGASHGIGRQTALVFSKAGFNTVITATNEAALKELESEIKAVTAKECLVISGDLSDINFVEYIPNAALEKFGRIDVLVNNAAWRTIETMRSIQIETWEKTLRICLTAPAFLAKFCAAHMEKLNITESLLIPQALCRRWREETALLILPARAPWKALRENWRLLMEDEDSGL
jgi:NAD(P)-dependent dehydrogenase (short-subunit alcohol dehydrogenase family)